MESDADENDGFDWEAAAAAMEHISLFDHQPRFERNEIALKEIPYHNVQNANIGAGMPPTVHTKLQQKTLLSFVQRSNQQPSSMERINQMPVNNSELSPDDILNTDGPCIDLEAARTWVYPVNVPMRDYQYSIVQTALFSNTLVSLPTGLGKTLIAAVVIYNFFRWFPTGKIVFIAPSRPLVLQQIEACHDSVGIPQEFTIDMTGQINPGLRSTFWRNKRVFFATPQVFEKDIQSGSCPMQDLVCLVVDEAHRATGNYAYCVAVRKLMEVSVRLRILALTATPGSKQVTIQSVVDNLRISCLEYRNENDPDVKQFVHNRKLELLQVPMDSESTKIRDLFLEVLQPFVNRLCGVGVFYSKDAARLVPYEFLTARDKFRQAPPPGLDPRQFGEVEACFGATITLYHMFKLLFSHGIRPSFEMLKEKLQSGPFGRLMGRNEKLQEIKVLMQKHVRNGASSPKLTKLLQLMADHFESNDPSKTRVIIFTNFRESVKDILEALKILGDIVKAMEFIGQNSGKSSKGQSQKVQQLVLQKFRMGGFNTIVATSIAEEGLDIMEVDLVICFDANVSPLRMIQRMGRTGRKRDGRVIILASEGAEVQGYLKKQAKSKVLGKHMHNGGLHSFNFHSSPRMVPHSIKPEPQLVELSIEKFVPRVKNKQKVVQMVDPTTVDLNPEESLILRRYIKPHQAASDRWKPSLIAFPHCQLLPTQVHNVKHSERTIFMLIDTLQSLHEFKSRRSDDHQVCESIREDEGNLREVTLQKDGVKGDEYCEVACDKMNNKVFLAPQSPQSIQDEMTPHTIESPLGASLYSSPPSNREDDVSPEFQCQLRNTSATLGSQNLEPLFGEALVEAGPVAQYPAFSGVNTVEQKCTGPYLTEKAHVLEVEDCSRVPVNLRISKFSNSTEKCSLPPLPPDSHLKCLLLNGDDSPTCEANLRPSGFASWNRLYNQGIVSIDASGYVQVASPPMLPLRSSFLQLLDCEANTKYHSFLSFERELSMTEAQRKFKSLQEKQTMDLTPDSTPANKTYLDENGIYDDSPRLCTLAEQGLVPSSPGLEIKFSQPVNFSTKKIKHLGNAVNDVRSSPLMQCGTVPPSAAVEKRDKVGDDKLQPDKLISLGKCEPQKQNTDGNWELDNHIFDDTVLTRALSAIRVSNGKEVEKLPANSRTSVLQLSDGSNWNQPLEVSSSAQKPRKFRRLCKVKEASKQVSGELQQDPNRRRWREELGLNELLKKRTGKKKLRCEAALLVDEEAEVSSGEDVSTDEDDDEDVQGSLQDFINDQVEPTVGTLSGTEEHVDMMAVYRKSLLTQSPLDGCALPWMRRLLQTRTPVSGESNFTSESIISVSSGSHGRVEPGSGRDSTGINRELPVTPSLSDYLTICNSQAREPTGLTSGEKEGVQGQLQDSMHSTTKAQERKRKLSFQQDQTLAGCYVPTNLSGQFDDDLFAGLDLDALEVEAVQKSRFHTQGTSGTQPRAASGIVLMRSGNEDADLNRVHDENLDVFPSFNLGIDC